jgi:hypothetical protein
MQSDRHFTYLVRRRRYDQHLHDVERNYLALEHYEDQGRDLYEVTRRLDQYRERETNVDQMLAELRRTT